MSKNKFCEIEDAQKLVSYLKEKQRTNGITRFSKYMKLSSLIDMLTSEMILINNPVNMNDLYEYRAFVPKPKWEKICFASLITQSVESMAMWSMYAQPWAEGIMVSFPANAFTEMVANQEELINAELDEKTKRYVPGDGRIPAKGLLSIARVAYTDGKTVTCTGRDDRNRNFVNPYGIPELAGYIKDIAWDYEKEVRLRVDLPDSYYSDAIFLKLPESLLKQITITTGPRFEGNVLMALPKKYKASVNIVTSKFHERLAWIPCDNCKKNKSE